MATLTLSIEIPATAKATEVEAELVKKAKNMGCVATKGDETAQSANETLASHIKAFGELVAAHQKASENATASNETLGSHIKALAKCIKDMGGDDGAGEASAAAGNTKASPTGDKLSTSQMKRAKTILKAVSDSIAAHHSAQGADGGEPDPDAATDGPGDNDHDEDDKASTEAVQKKIAELNAAADKIEMRLTGKVPARN